VPRPTSHAVPPESSPLDSAEIRPTRVSGGRGGSYGGGASGLGLLAPGLRERDLSALADVQTEGLWQTEVTEHTGTGAHDTGF
jgi:hypothetical protein